MEKKVLNTYEVSIRNGYGSVTVLKIPCENLFEAYFKGSQYILDKRLNYSLSFICVRDDKPEPNSMKSVYDSLCDMKIISIVELPKND